MKDDTRPTETAAQKVAWIDMAEHEYRKARAEHDPSTATSNEGTDT